MEENGRNNPRIIARVNETASDSALERLLRTRRSSLTADNSLPGEVRARSLFQPEEQGLFLKRTSHNPLSPHILSLRAPAQEPEASFDGVNMLDGEVVEIVEGVENGLGLDRDDLAGQLLEETLPLIDTSKTSLQYVEIALPDLAGFRREAELLGLNALEVAPDGADLSVLAPVSMPERLANMFELPDADESEGEEEDVLIEFAGHDEGVVTIEEVGEVWDVREVEEEINLPNLPNLPNIPNLSFWRLPQLRTLGAFVLLSFAIVLPIHAMNVAGIWGNAKDAVTKQGETGATLLSSGASSALSRDASEAARAFGSAQTSFAQAQSSVSNLGVAANAIISALPSGSKVASANAVLTAGEALSIAGGRISEGIASLGNDPLASPTDRIALLQAYLEGALPHLERAEAAIAKVDVQTLPPESQSRFTILQQSIPSVVSGIRELIEVTDAAYAVLGGTGTKRYLAIFQNNTEIRPTGGFMGSFAEMDIRKGEIAKLTIPGGGTYDLRAGVMKPFISPKPLRLLSAAWEFQDANWFPDFPTSARQIMQFYEHAGQPTVDGVIAVNATFVASLLDLLGSIEMPEYGRTIDSKNFLLETQKIVENEYDRDENKPKAFIGDLAPKLLEKAKALPPEGFLAFLDTLQQGLSSRDIQIYFDDQELQKQVIERGWGGELKWSDGDYFMAVDTNLGGGKTDGVIQQKIDIKVNIEADGTVTDSVTVTRTHFGQPGSDFSGVNNVDYLRLYVPKGSELLSADGFSIPDASLFDAPMTDWLIDDDLIYGLDGAKTDAKSGTDIFEESGKTVFGNWIQTKPGATSTAHFTYRLPFKVEVGKADPTLIDRLKTSLGVPNTGRYTLTLQKQSGILDRTTTVHLTAPEAWNLAWSSHETDGVSFTNAMDSFFATIFERN